jgi:hypothetical protein
MADPAPFALFVDFSETNSGVPGRDQGWRIQLVARVKSRFQDALVFRYQKISAEEVLFTGVCSPADLADYGPSPRGDDGFFRSDTAKLDFASRDDAYKIRDEIIAELDTLCVEMARISDSMSPVQTIEISSNPSTNVDPQ